MKIKHTTAVAMFVALGFKAASNWTIAKFDDKLSKLNEGTDEEDIKRVEDENTQKMIRKVIKARIADEAVTVDPASVAAPTPPETEEPAEDDDAEKGEPAAPAAKAKKTPKADKGESTRPGAGSKTGKVWDIADKLTAKGKKTADRVSVVEACVKAGLNKSTASVQYANWAKTQ